MSQPGTLSRTVLALCWLVVGLAMVGVPTWLGFSRGATILSGHPAMLIAGIACGLLGFVALAWSVATLTVGGRLDRGGEGEYPVERSPQQIRRRATWRIALAVPTLLLCTALVALLAYSRPMPATGAVSAALRSQDGVQIAERLSWYELIPAKQDESGKVIKPTTGLVFVPGARVDSRAYAPLLRPLAEAGYLVIVLKEPFGFSIFQSDHPETVIDLHPEIAQWAIGGHSLGGVTAAGYADAHEQVKGLVLFASYPASPLVRTDLKVVSISGSADALTTPSDIDSTKERLPESTTYVVVDGAVHSTFGDYVGTPTDGLPFGDRAAQQEQIVTTTSDLLASLAPPPKKKKKK